MSPERLFLVLASIFGLAFLAITPPFQVPDEPVHFYRSFHVSEAHLLGRVIGQHSGDYLPASLQSLAVNLSGDIPLHPWKKLNYRRILNQFDRPLNPDERAFIDFRGSALYSPVPYLPQALGIAIGRILHPAPITLFYFGRLANLLAWIALTFWAIRITPVFKWVFLLLALAPMSMFQAASLSADGLTHGLSFLLIAVFLYLAFGPVPQIERRHFISLVILAVLLSLTKQAYIFLLGLYFLIPAQKFGSWKRYAGAGLVLLITALAAWGLWSVLASRIYIPNRVEDTIRPADQLHFILNDPLNYLRVFLVTFFHTDRDVLIKSYIGLLGWLDTPLPRLIYPAFLISLFAVAICDHSPSVRLSLANRITLGVILLVSLAFLAITAYLLWTPVGSGTIESIQGRYFIPLAPLFFLLFYNHKIRITKQAVSLAIPFFVSIILSVAIRTLLVRYYRL